MHSVLMFAIAAASSGNTANDGGIVMLNGKTCDPDFMWNDVKVPTCGTAATLATDSEGLKICKTAEGTKWCYVKHCLPKDVEKDASMLCHVGEMPGPESLSAESVRASRASSSMRDTLLYNGMRAWKDVPKARISKLPATLEWRRALVPSVRTKPNFKVELDCVFGGAGGMCDHFVFMYSCPPCQFADGGNLVSLLLAEGFIPHRCNTVFDLDYTEDSQLHNVVIYHKQTPAGERDVIQAPEMLEFVWYSLSQATSYCPGYETQETCSNADPKECVWRDDACHPHFCPKPKLQQGPFPRVRKCQVCPFDAAEARYIPELLE